jgi:hypothetical protein
LNASSFTVSGFYDINGQFRQGMWTKPELHWEI